MNPTTPKIRLSTQNLLTNSGGRSADDVFRNLTTGTPLYIRFRRPGWEEAQCVGRFVRFIDSGSKFKSNEVRIENDYIGWSGFDANIPVDSVSIVIQLSDVSPVTHLQDLGLFRVAGFPIHFRHYGGTRFGKVVKTYRKTIDIEFKLKNGKTVVRNKNVLDCGLPQFVRDVRP